MIRIYFPVCFIMSFLWAPFSCAQTFTEYIVVDQFGYLPDSKKIAVIRDPQTGYDASGSFTPGGNYIVVNALTGAYVFSGTPVLWKAGAQDASSGDRAWWFDFSSVTSSGIYYLLDEDNNVRSYEFQVSASVYNKVLEQAVRTFFYQRAGFEKAEQYAGAGWSDGASHIGPLQDKNARIYNNKNGASTEADVQGGWYDAGDYNKYTNWTANYIVDFMRAYLENPAAWRDDYNIPESGNGLPDLLDEARWGLEFLLRMQNADGSVLSIVSLAQASPPSAATGQSLYGPASTTATLNTAAAFALASKVYASVGMEEFSNTLKESAVKAWNWAEANPDVRFYNNSTAHGTQGLGAGQQEPGLQNEEEYVYSRLVFKLEAACFLFELTGESIYRDYFENNYEGAHLLQWSYAYPFETSNQEILLHYAALPGATTSVTNTIRSAYLNAMNGEDNFAAFYNDTDPYRAYIKDYTWGSNSIKAAQGLMFTDMLIYGIDVSKEEDAKTAAEGYIHYLHGVNPFNMVYLSNMYGYGGDNCVNEFYHAWFAHGSPRWDRVGVSTYGPPPGFLTGGPNPSYNYDACCPSGCGGSNAICNSESLIPPKGQPPQKSYKDFNTSWPLNSWAVTENSCGYQINYIRLLSKFVDGSYDCSGTKAGLAVIDACGQCAGGNTGITPVPEASQCPSVSVHAMQPEGINISPNPFKKVVKIITPYPGTYQVTILDPLGKKILSERRSKESSFNMSDYPPGIYLVIVEYPHCELTRKIIKF